MALDDPLPQLLGLVPEPVRCGYCVKKDLTGAMKFCPNCGFPVTGTKEEQQGFVDRRLMVKFRDENNAERVRKARNALYWVTGLNLLPYLLTKQPAIIIVGVVISLIFLGLALWTRAQPYPAILTALALYVLLILLAAIEQPLNLVSGIIVKIAVLSALFYALRELKQPPPERRPG